MSSNRIAEDSVPHSLFGSEQRDRAVIENLPDPVLIVDVAGRIIWASPAARTLGLDPSESAGHSVFEGIHSDDAERFQQALSSAIGSRGNAIIVRAVRRVAGLGNQGCFDERLTYLPDTPGIRGVLIIAHEVSERQVDAGPAAIPVDKSHFNVKSEQSAVFTADATGRFQYVNRAAAAAFGSAPEEIVGKPVAEFLSPILLEQYRGDIEQVMRTGEDVIVEEQSQIKGRDVWLSTIVQPIRDDCGHVTAARLIAHDVTSFKNIERELRKNEERLRQMVRLSGIGIFDHDHVSDEIYWSPELREIYGWRPEESVRFSRPGDSQPGTWDLIHPEDRERVAAAVDHARHDPGGVFDIDYRIIRRDGSLRWISTRGQTFFEGEGEARRPVRTIGATQDITERNRTELALRRSQERLQQVLQVYDIGVFEQDHASGALYWSPELRSTWRLNPDQEPGVEAFWSAIHPEDLKRAQLAVEKAHDPAGDGRYDIQFRITSSDGELRWIDARSQTLFEGEGEARRPVRTVGAVMDITERRRVDEALRVSERSLREAQRIANIGDWELDYATDRVTWSDEIFRVFEIDPTHFTVSYQSFLSCVHPEDRARVDAACSHAWIHHTPYQITHRILTPSGQVKHIEERAQTEFGPDGKPRYWRGTSQDVTARVAAESALRASLQEKETLLREIHHRVKNNLQIIASLLHFQAKRVRDPADLAAFTDCRNRLRAMILVHEKLYQSRDLSSIDFGNYLRSLVRDLQHSHNVGGRRLDIQVSTEPVELPIQLAVPCGMIVCELLTNVFKYAFPDGKTGGAQVSLTAIGTRVRLCVSDNGVGLPPTFDPLHGSSFGWELIRNLTKQVGGEINIDRDGGTRVTIAFTNNSEAAAA